MIAIKQTGLSHIDNAVRNKNIILNIIRDKAPLSRKDIFGVSKLSLATTKRLTEELLGEQLIVEKGVNKSHRGRKASLLQLNEDLCYTIGVNIAPHSIEIIGLKLIGTTYYKRKIENIEPNKESIIPKLKEELTNALHFSSKRCKGELLGIGIGIAGLVNTVEGIVLYSPTISGWENVNLSSIIDKDFHTEVIIDDTVRCMALTEKRYGSGKDFNNFLYIYIGDGVGSGIMLDGRLYRGKHGVAGEFGHITIRQEGNLCNCGNKGCLEAHVSVNPILQEINKSISSNVYSSLKNIYVTKGQISLQNIFDEAMKGDKLANIMINTVSEDIGTGLADLINIFDPGVIILGGEVIDIFNELVMDGIVKAVRLKAINAIASRTSIIKSTVPEYSGAIGAATLLLEKFLKNEIINV